MRTGPMVALLAFALGVAVAEGLDAASTPFDAELQAASKLAAPLGAVKFKKRCGCHKADNAEYDHKLGVLFYAEVSNLGSKAVAFECYIPVFDVGSGALTKYVRCQDWTAL